jgi:hypothetical protein
MSSILIPVAYVLMALFAIGVAGCAIAIPIVAFKFFYVLFEKDNGEREQVAPE